MGLEQVKALIEQEGPKNPGVEVQAREHHLGGVQLIFRFPNGYGASVIPEYDLATRVTPGAFNPANLFVPRVGECEIALIAWGEREDDFDEEQDDFWLVSGEQYTGFEWDQVQRHVPLSEALWVIERVGMLPTRRKEIES